MSHWCTTFHPDGKDNTFANDKTNFMLKRNFINTMQIVTEKLLLDEHSTKNIPEVTLQSYSKQFSTNDPSTSLVYQFRRRCKFTKLQKCGF